MSKSASAVAAKYRDELMSRRGVVDVSYGPEGVIVHLRDESDALNVPISLDGIPVVYRVVGKPGPLPGK
ncbi:MAG: hypothetical protein QFX35_06960 [Candidatus Verstraetearchaeota archaeon]|nr:hypothetical protein [Candidatus Verstraetearchaeota archaeon]